MGFSTFSKTIFQSEAHPTNHRSVACPHYRTPRDVLHDQDDARSEDPPPVHGEGSEEETARAAVEGGETARRQSTLLKRQYRRSVAKGDAPKHPPTPRIHIRCSPDPHIQLSPVIPPARKDPPPHSSPLRGTHTTSRPNTLPLHLRPVPAPGSRAPLPPPAARTTRSKGR